MTGYEVAYQDDNLRLSFVDNVFFAAWFDAPSLDQMRTVDRVYKSFKRRISGGVVFVNLALEGIPRFSAEVREEAARQTAEADARELATCHLVLVGGLTGSAVRAFMSTAMLLGRPPHPTKVFGDVATAARWMGERLAGNDAYRWDEARIEQAIDKATLPLAP